MRLQTRPWNSTWSPTAATWAFSAATAREASAGPRRVLSAGPCVNSAISTRRPRGHNGDHLVLHQVQIMKNPSSRAEKIRRPTGSPRHVALKLAAIVCVPVGLVIAATLLWDYIWPRSDPEARRAARELRDKQPPKLNPSTPPGPAPEGMVWIPGGEFWMGVAEDVDAESRFAGDLYGD